MHSAGEISGWVVACRHAACVDGANAAMPYLQQWLWERVAGWCLAERRAGSAFEERPRIKVDPDPFDLPLVGNAGSDV